MGTRGSMGFRLHDKDYLVYNHFDSYPSCLGRDIAQFINEKIVVLGYDGFIGECKQRVLSLQAIDEDVKPTENQKNYLKPYADLEVSNRSLDDWYCLLRKTQGDIGMFLEARYFVSSEKFMQDGLFCEHAYVINLDNETLEYYEGFEKWTKFNAKHKSKGRYWPLGPTDSEKEDIGSKRGAYGPVALKKTFVLKEFPGSIEFVNILEPPAKEDAA